MEFAAVIRRGLMQGDGASFETCRSLQFEIRPVNTFWGICDWSSPLFCEENVRTGSGTAVLTRFLRVFRLTR